MLKSTKTVLVKLTQEQITNLLDSNGIEYTCLDKENPAGSKCGCDTDLIDIKVAYQDHPNQLLLNTKKICSKCNLTHSEQTLEVKCWRCGSDNVSAFILDRSEDQRATLIECHNCRYSRIDNVKLIKYID